jgi:hypothetical protein
LEYVNESETPAAICKTGICKYELAFCQQKYSKLQRTDNMSGFVAHDLSGFIFIYVGDAYEADTVFLPLLIGTFRDMGYPLKGSGSYSESEGF